MKVGVNASWKDVEADSFCDSVRDGTHESPKFVEDGHFLITSKNIRNGRVMLETANLISEQDFSDINRRSKVDQWDVLFSMIGTVGEVCLVREEEPPFAIKNIGLFKVGNELKAKWLYYWLCSPMTQAAIRQACRGASQQYIPLGELRKFPVCVPTKPGVMRKIVDVLSAYDDLIENNRRRIAFLEEAARLLHREWFVHLRFPGHELIKIIDGIPKGWERRKLGVVAENYDRKRVPLSVLDRDQRRGEFPYYGAAGILDYIDDYLFDGRYLLMGEDGTVITERGTPLLQLVEGKFWVNNHAHVLRGKDLSTEHLYCALKEYKIQGHVTGVAQPKITQKSMNRIPVTVAPDHLRRGFQDIVSPLFAQRFALGTQNECLHRARNLLLPRLMSGKITV